MKEPYRFLPFLPVFPLFPRFFPILGFFFAVRGGTLPPLHPQWLRHWTCLDFSLSVVNNVDFPALGALLGPFSFPLITFVAECW